MQNLYLDVDIVFLLMIITIHLHSKDSKFCLHRLILAA